MLQSEQIDKLVEALAKAQAKIKNPVKNKKVHVRTKTGGSYEFEYADLTAIIDCVREPLTSQGLWFTQTLSLGDNGKYQLQTTLLHSSGQWLGSTTPLLVEEPGNQPFGSGLTFMKRYALSAMLGVSADADDDANTADGNEAKVEDKRAAKAPKAAAPSIIEAPKAPTGNSTEVPGSIPLPTDPVNGKSDWLTFGRNFKNAVEAATPEDRPKWRAENQLKLTLMEQEAHRVYTRLGDALTEIFPDGLKST